MQSVSQLTPTTFTLIQNFPFLKYISISSKVFPFVSGITITVKMIERAQFPAKIQNVPCGVNTTC